jgi:RND family efflux transporter MFP subunit
MESMVKPVMQTELDEQVEKLKEALRPTSPRKSPRSWLVPVLAVLAAVLVLGFGIRSRVRAETTLRAMTDQMAVPSVSVVTPKQTAPATEIILPGNMQPFISSPIYARTDGYLKKWYFDIGAHVKAGELLAVIQTPEVDEQLAQARSTLNTAEANLKLAQITRDRYQSLLTKHAVAQQDVDNAVGAYTANNAIVDADTANVRHYEALVSFEKVYAPFDGVITARNTDIGDLINSGSNTAPRTDLFDIAQTRSLRVYVNVPEEYSQGVKPGQTTAEVALAEFPGKRFPGKLVRTSESINATTRTLLVEVDLDNPGGNLFSGSYAEVHLKIASQNSAYLLPVSALIFRSDKLQVGVVKNGKVSVTDVTPGHDFGDQIEIVSGLRTDDQVVMDPPDSLVSGQEVKIAQAVLPGEPQ